MTNEFEEEPKGVVVSMEEEAFAGYLYTIWFPYTRKNVRKIREGMFFAVKNFQSDDIRQIFGILEAVSVLPQHYALGSSREVERAFPGFFLEAAKSCRQDWEQDEPVEQTTLIKVQAISTGLQVAFEGGRSGSPKPEENYPMIGEEAHILSESFTNRIVNQGLESPAIPTIAPCNLILNPAVQIHISIEDMLRTHFGIFGFTGAGKSNIMSTLLHHLITQENSTIKIVLMDLMSEYTGLLVDVIDRFDESYIVVFGEDSLPGGEPTLEYLTGDSTQEDAAVESIQRTLLLPKELELIPYRNLYGPKIRNILRDGKIRVYYEGNILTYSRVREAVSSQIGGNLGTADRPIRSWVDARLSGDGGSELRTERIAELIGELNGFLGQEKIPESFLSEPQSDSQQALQLEFEGGNASTAPRPSQRTIDVKQTARNVLLAMRDTLQNFLNNTQEERPENMVISFDQIYSILNSKDSSSLIIFQCNRDDELRERSSSIVNGIFNYRRRIGRIDPTVLFVYDEADEFIPRISPNPTYGRSLGAVRNIARRGRKFGLGLTIASQRVAYLDTSILAQPHTYLLSKMPRKYDRDTLADAFGITEDMMRKTLKFTKGQWLLMSYDATGLTNVPIPVSFPNANDRIIEYLRNST